MTGITTSKKPFPEMHHIFRAHVPHSLFVSETQDAVHCEKSLCCAAELIATIN